MAIGMKCAQGVLLVADSLEPAIDPSDPRYPFWLDGRKILYLAGSDNAMVVSGYVDDGMLEANDICPDHHSLRPWLPREEPRARVRRVHAVLQAIDATVRARHPGYDRYADFADPGPHSLFAIGGPEPQLARLTTGTERWAEVGDVLAIGGWLLGMYPELAAEMARPAPESLEACKALVVRWVHEFMDRVFGYQDAYAMVRETGTRPCMSWPLQMLTMTATHHQREVIPCSIGCWPPSRDCRQTGRT